MKAADTCVHVRVPGAKKMGIKVGVGKEKMEENKREEKWKEKLNHVGERSILQEVTVIGVLAVNWQ